jgi:hypothetical protein
MRTCLLLLVGISAACSASSTDPQATDPTTGPTTNPTTAPAVVTGSEADAGPSGANAAVSAAGFDAYDGQTVHAVVWDDTAGTLLASGDTQTVAGGAFAFTYPFASDPSHLVYFFAYADTNGDGTCSAGEPVWGLVLYGTQSLQPDEIMGDCSHF